MISVEIECEHPQKAMSITGNGPIYHCWDCGEVLDICCMLCGED